MPPKLPSSQQLSADEKAEALVEYGLADNIEEAMEMLEDMGELYD